jgi:hypothetical protein
VRSEKIGDHGKTKWLVELECEHILKLARKPSHNRVCCVACTKAKEPDIPVMDMDPALDAVKLAHYLGIDGSQVAVYDGGAQVTLDTFQLRRLLG